MNISSAKKMEGQERLYEGRRAEILKLAADEKSSVTSPVKDQVRLSSQAELERVWQGIDAENKVRGKFKKFEITPDGKYKIETKNGSETIADPANKTSIGIFKSNGNSYEVEVECKNGIEYKEGAKVNVTRVMKNGKEVQDGDYSYIDGDVGYIYEGIGSNGANDYFKTKLNRFDTDYFKAVDGNIVSDTERYNKLYSRSKELENLMRIVPMDDNERNKKIAKLEEKIKSGEFSFDTKEVRYHGIPTYKKLSKEFEKLEDEEYLVKKYLNHKDCKPRADIRFHCYHGHMSGSWPVLQSEWDGILKRISEEYGGIAPTQGDLDTIGRQKDKIELERKAVLSNFCKTYDNPVNKEALKNITDEDFSFKLSHREDDEGWNYLAELRTILKHDGRDEMKAVKHEYDKIIEDLKTMRADTGYQEKVKNAVKENILPGIVIE